MKGSFLISIALAILLTAGIPTLIASPGETGSAPTRAAGEDMTIDIRLTFDGPLGYELDVTLEIRMVYLNGSLTSAETIRSMYGVSPDETLQNVEEEMWNRAVNLTGTSFQGDSFEVISGGVVITSMDNSTNGPSDPVIYQMSMTGSTEIERFMDGSRASLIEEGREDLFITSLFMSGFTYTRSIGLTAHAGELVNYHIPSSFDPVGDGDVSLDLESDDGQPDEYGYLVTVDGTSGYTENIFSFTIVDDEATSPMDEYIEGDLTVDWKELDTVGLTGSLDISTVSSDRSSLMTSAPNTMTVPSNVPASLIRYAHLEGVLTDADLEDMEADLEGEVDTSIRQALGDDEISSSIDIQTGSGSIERPVIGSDLRSIIEDGSPVTAAIGTTRDSVLDILKGYEKDDVMGLLNAGVRMYHDLDQVNDDRFDVHIMAPDGIEIWGDPHVRMNGTRKVYDYEPGRILIGSELAPEYEGSRMRVGGMLDLSNIKSMYVLDTEVNIEADIDFDLSVMKFDQEELDLETDIEYEVDYLSSDMIRLLMDMEIIDREEIEDKIETDFTEGIGDILPDDDSFTIDILDESLIFDDDTTNMTGEEPITLNIAVSASLSFDDLMNDDDNGDEGARTVNGIIPFHLDPLFPVRSIERTVDLGEARNWELDLEISLPSGLGIEAWTGLEENDHIRDLEIETDGGYPTLHLELEPGEADRITFKVEVGGYLLVNNIGACFGCCLLGIMVVLLMFLLIVIKIARKKKKGSGNNEEKEDSSEKSDDSVEDEEGDDEEMSWDDT